MEKKTYDEARLRVVKLSGSAHLLSGSTPISGSAPGLMHGSYTSAGGVFE
ncbi:MAG: hypothetical protein J6I31_03360 [Prevotella sp.]|nr:hypothetical protein [Prevotella sp.]